MLLRIARSFLSARRLAATLLLLGITSGLAPHARAAEEVLDGVAAVVSSGGIEDVITFSQVRELVGSKEKAAREQLKGEALIAKLKEIRLAAINDLIDRQLILQEFKKNKFQIPDHFLDERIAAITREEFGGDRSAFARTLAAQGYTLDRFKEMERDKIIVQEMRRQAMKSNIVIPESTILDYYRKNIQEYTSEEQIKLRMIAIKKSGDGTQRRKMIDEIREKIVAGAEFQDLARMYSDDSTQEAGGDWGWINRKTLNEDLTKLAFALKPGEVSKVIDLGTTYYLLHVEAKKSPTSKPVKEVREEIEKKLIQAERQRLQQEWLQKLRKKAYIKMLY